MGTRSAATEMHMATASDCAVFSAADSCALITAGLGPVGGEPEGTTGTEVDVTGDPAGLDGVADPAVGGGVDPDVTAGSAALVDDVAAGEVGPRPVDEGFVAGDVDPVGCAGGSGIPLGCGPGDTAGMANPISDASAIRCCRCSSRSGPSSSARAGADASARS